MEDRVQEQLPRGASRARLREIATEQNISASEANDGPSAGYSPIIPTPVLRGTGRRRSLCIDQLGRLRVSFECRSQLNDENSCKFFLVCNLDLTDFKLSLKISSKKAF